MDIWQGRIDDEENSPAPRWHQKIQAWDGSSDLNHNSTLLGFACDEGVSRNQGRIGARYGPSALRRAMANMAYFQKNNALDAGDILCEAQDLEQAQQQLANHVENILHHHGLPLVLGGGHEQAWGNFLGISQYVSKTQANQQIGIINFDAHFDLRNPLPQATSGTPFRQIASYCEHNQKNFNYLVFGINPTANTSALFEFAKQHQVIWHNDIHCTLSNIAKLETQLQNFLPSIDALYLTICLDVFAANLAPGVSAPSVIGIDPVVVIHLIKVIKTLCKTHGVKLMLADIAELNPNYDINAMTAKLAARLVHEIVNEQKMNT